MLVNNKGPVGCLNFLATFSFVSNFNQSEHLDPSRAKIIAKTASQEKEYSLSHAATAPWF
jgi:hypothetical protein